MLVPVIAMPLSLIGTFFVMLVLGYSINLLTLLALVLAIGLVVDDAIIVVENVDRHMKEGTGAVAGGAVAARELGGPIIAMTVVLVAVYVPIGFQGGLTGALFTEFAFTLAGAVAVSGVVALTLSPMMCSRFFTPEQDSGRFAHGDRPHLRARAPRLPARCCAACSTTWPVLIVMGVILLVLPGADVHDVEVGAGAGGRPGHRAVADARAAERDDRPDADLCATRCSRSRKAIPEYEQMFQITGVPTLNQGIGGVLFKPWDQRTRSAHEIQNDLQAASGTRSPAPASRRSSSRRCPAPRACRCSS